MLSGYCHVLAEEQRLLWNRTSDDDWDIEVYTPLGTEVLVGARHIDGSLRRVYLCPDGRYRAWVFVGSNKESKNG